jgi:hypothetical protein
MFIMMYVMIMLFYLCVMIDIPCLLLLDLLMFMVEVDLGVVRLMSFLMRLRIGMHLMVRL